MAQPKSNKALAVGGESQNTAGYAEIYDDINKTWTLLDDLNIRKHNYTAALINNKIMIIGGSDSSDTPLRTVESWDLLTGRFTTMSPLNHHRENAVSAVVGEGKFTFLYVFGGMGKEKTALHTVERWDPVTNVWTLVTPMKSARTGHGAAVLGDEIYIVGGKIGGRYFDNTVEAYNYKTDKWSVKVPMKHDNADFGITVFKNHLYIVGGNKANEVYINTVERYDPIENSWTSLAHISSTGRVGACVLGSSLICAGGSDSNTVEEYNEDMNIWTELPSMKIPRNCFLFELPKEINDDVLQWITDKNTSNKIVSIGSWDMTTSDKMEVYNINSGNWFSPRNLKLSKRIFSASFVDNELLLIGGTYSEENENPLKEVLSLDLKTGLIVEIAPMLDPRMFPASAVIGEGQDSVLYVIGGLQSEDTPINTVEKWNPITRAWTRVKPMSEERSGHGAAVLYGKIYVMGGRTDSSYVNTMEVYNIKSDEWEPKAPMNNVNAYFGVAAMRNYLYVVGGNSSSDVAISSVERYDALEDSWVVLANISTEGSLGACSINNSLFYAGEITQVYDEENDEWNDLAPLSITRVSYLLELPLHMRDYKFDWL